MIYTSSKQVAEEEQKAQNYTGGRGTGDERTRLNKIVKGKIVDNGDRYTDRFAFLKSVEGMIAENFGDNWRWQIVPEVYKYKPSKSKEVRDQIQGNAPKVVEIYFDKKYLCDVKENESRELGLAKIHVALVNRIK